MSSGTPSTSHSLRNWPSFAAATMRSLSLVGKGSYGNTLGCALPIRNGTTPPAAYAELWFTRPVSAEDNRLTSTSWPWPVASRWRSAARMPITAWLPAITSNTEMPAR